MLSTVKLHIHTFLLLVPTPIAFPDKAEHDGRYSEGSHNQFSELYVIHSPSAPKAQPEYWGLRGSATLVRFDNDEDDAPRAILPMSV